MGSGGDRRNSWATYAGSAAHRRAYLPAADLLSSPGASELDGPIAQLDDRIARRYSSECPPAARSDSDRRPDAVHPVTADSPIVEGPAARSCRARYSSLRSVRLLSTTAAAPPESFAVAAARFGGFRGHGPDLGRIPLYNRAAEVRSTIASLLAQSYCNLELIVVDDASTDDLQGVVASFVDPRVLLAMQCSRGPSANCAALQSMLSCAARCLLRADLPLAQMKSALRSQSARTW